MKFPFGNRVRRHGSLLFVTDDEGKIAFATGSPSRLLRVVLIIKSQSPSACSRAVRVASAEIDRSDIDKISLGKTFMVGCGSGGNEPG